MNLTPQQVARKIAAAASDKKARDILLLNMENLSPLTDYFIIASADNVTLVKAVADNIEEKLAEEGILPSHTEGYAEGRWILMDYGDCVAAIFIIWNSCGQTLLRNLLRRKKMNKLQPHAKYRPGDVVTLKAVRASEMGVFLDAGTGNTDDDILLHKLQQETEVKVGDSVKVYLYLDPHGRLTASMKLPKMREGQLGYVKVLSVTRDGGFVDIGAERGVFLPYSQMRGL